LTLAQLRAENARLLKMLELSPRQAAPPGPVQAGCFLHRISTGGDCAGIGHRPVA
jgi:hypothetical protein